MDQEKPKQVTGVSRVVSPAVNFGEKITFSNNTAHAHK